MSNPDLILRSNDNSSLAVTLRARNSKQNFLDYVSEGESVGCPSAKSRQIINPISNIAANGGQRIRFELTNFGFLSDLYLQTSFVQGGTNADGSNKSGLVDHAGIHCIERARVVYNGNTLAELTSDQIMCSLYTRASNEEVGILDAMTGGAALGSVAAVGSLTGRRALASVNGGQQLSCPLKFWFSESLGRAWDLYSLSARAYVEIDFRPIAELINVQDAGAHAYSSVQLVSYIQNLSNSELVAYQSRNYAPNSVSSQIAFTTTQFDEVIASPVLITATGAGNKVKLQSISGLVRRLYLFATIDGDKTSTTDKKLDATIDISSFKLMANNQSIYENEHCGAGIDNLSLSAGDGYHTDHFVEAFHNRLPMGANKLFDNFVGGSLGGTGGVQFKPSHVKVINFGMNPQTTADADSFLSFSQLSVPEVEVKFPTGTSGSHTLHAIAELVVLHTYNTSSSGQINYKLITE
jgi:hypothetical protein